MTLLPSLLLTSGERVALLCAVTTALYVSPLLMQRTDQWEFISLYDDHNNFASNPVLQSNSLFSWENLIRMATMRRINVYEPLSWLLKALIVQYVGLNSWAIRAVTMVLHFAAGWVLVKVSVRLSEINNLLTRINCIRNTAPEPGLRVSSTAEEDKEGRHSHQYFLGCCLSALLFLVHPVHVEVVAWPSAQPYTLAALFANLSLLFYTQKVHHNLQRVAVALVKPSRRNEADTIDANFAIASGGFGKSELLALGFYMCSVLSKSVCVLLPLGFLLLDAFVILKLPSIGSRRSLCVLTQCVIQKAPVLLVLLAFAGITLWSNEEGSKIDADVLSLTLLERVLKALTTPAWIIRQLVWPARLRVHFQLREDELGLFGNPECLLSVVVLILCAVTGVWRAKQRQSPELLLVLLYFCIVLLPTSGLIQHGIVTFGCPRYAYFPSMVFVPFGGYALGNLLFGDATPAQQAQSVEQVSAEKRIDSDLIKPAHSVATRVNSSPPKKSQPKPFRAAENLQFRVLLAYLGALCACVLISTSQMEIWRNKQALYKHSLRLDPSDWRMYEWSAVTSPETRGECSVSDAKCRSLWELSYVFAPRKTLKVRLFRIKVLFALDRRDHACELSVELLNDHSHSAHVLNNAGICSLRSGNLSDAREFFIQAARSPGYEKFHKTPLQNLQSFDTWMAAFRAQHGGRAPTAGEIGGIVAAIMW